MARREVASIEDFELKIHESLQPALRDHKKVMVGIWSVDQTGTAHSHVCTYQFPTNAMRFAMQELEDHCNLPEPLRVTPLPAADVDFGVDV